MYILKNAPAIELPMRAEVALRIMLIQAAANRSGPEFSLSDRNMTEALRLADRFLNALNPEMEDEAEANAFFARNYLEDEINGQFN